MDTNNLKPDRGQAKLFLQGRMASVDHGHMVIWCLKGKDGQKRSKFFGPGDSDKAALYCVDMAKKSWDVYFGQGFLRKPLQSPSRGKETDVVVILGVCFDGDIKGGIHKEDPENLPTKKELEAFFRDEIPFKASQIVASSPEGGRHLHWLFNEPFIIRSEDDRQFIKTLSENFQKVIIKKMKAKGWKQDNTSDLVRVLRIPGTYNFKGDAVLVEMIESKGYRYKPEAILEWVESESQQEAHGDHDGGYSDGGHVVHGDVEKIIQACEFLRHWRDHAADLTEPEWWAGVCAIHTEPGAEKIIHKYSKPYPDYTPEETIKKIREAQKLSGPMTCNGIRDKTGFEGCPSGGCGVGCPVHLGGGRIQWESPILLDDYTVPEFDVELPSTLGQMCKAVSAATETPIELATGDCLATIATAVHGKIIVRVKPGYTEPLNIWIATFLEPGNRKTAVLIATTRVLSTWEAAKREEEKPRIKQIESERKSQEARLKSLRTQYGKAKVDELDEIQHEILKTESEMEPVPVYSKIWADDITPEHFGTILGRHNERMAIISSEGGIFEIIGGRYNGGIPNMDVFLKSHAGDPVRVDRGSRDPVNIRTPTSTFGLSPQPDVLRSLAEKKGFRGRGLLGRFLYFLPKSNLGHRTLETDPIPESVKSNWATLVHTLLDIEPQNDQDGQVEPFVIDLDRAAYSEHLEFARMVEMEMREGGRFESMKDWAGKLPGAAARLAGLLHCVKHPSQPWVEKISLKTMQQALDLAAVFASHAEIAFEVMGADVAIEGAKKVWRWIEKGRFEFFKKRNCFAGLKSHFKKVVNIEPALEVLEERNYLSSFTHKTRGRPSVIYTVNPEIVGGWS